MKIAEFLQGPDGENSSKRLAGLLATFVFLLLSSVGGYFFLQRNDHKSFLELLDGVSLFAIGGLGLGVFDVFFKKKYGKQFVQETNYDDQIRR